MSKIDEMAKTAANRAFSGEFLAFKALANRAVYVDGYRTAIAEIYPVVEPEECVSVTLYWIYITVLKEWTIGECCRNVRMFNVGSGFRWSSEISEIRGPILSPGELGITSGKDGG